MKRFEFDDGMPNTKRWFVRAPDMRSALHLVVEQGTHTEPDDVEDARLPGFRFYFVVNNATGEVVNYLGVRERA